jgi:hypothetical protein
VPVLLYGSESWTVRIKYWTRIWAASMKFLKPMKGYSELLVDRRRVEDIEAEKGIVSLNQKDKRKYRK